MNNKIRYSFLIVVLSVALNNHHVFSTTSSVYYDTSTPAFSTEEEEYDMYDEWADQKIARGYKSQVSSVNKGLLGWVAMNINRAGSSLVLAYLGLQEWFAWFEVKTKSVWAWVKSSIIGKPTVRGNDKRRKA